MLDASCSFNSSTPAPSSSPDLVGTDTAPTFSPPTATVEAPTYELEELGTDASTSSPPTPPWRRPAAVPAADVPAAQDLAADEPLPSHLATNHMTMSDQLVWDQAMRNYLSCTLAMRILHNRLDERARTFDPINAPY